jgi:hypothetical protein
LGIYIGEKLLSCPVKWRLFAISHILEASKSLIEGYARRQKSAKWFPRIPTYRCFAFRRIGVSPCGRRPGRKTPENSKSLPAAYDEQRSRSLGGTK